MSMNNKNKIHSFIWVNIFSYLYTRDEISRVHKWRILIGDDVKFSNICYYLLCPNNPLKTSEDVVKIL